MLKRISLAPVLAITSGMLLWLWASAFIGKREPWDDPSYWQMVYPIAIGLSGLLGLLFPRQAWRWPVLLFIAQFVMMTIRNGEIGSLWPLGLVLFTVMSLPGVALAEFAAWLRRTAARK